MKSNIEIEDGREAEITVARVCAELVRQGVQFEVALRQKPIAGWYWTITFTGGY